MLTAQQICAQRCDAWSVTGRRSRFGRERSPGHHPARAFASLGAVLDRDQLDHRQVENLTNLSAHHGSVSKIRPTTTAVVRSMDTHLIRHVPRLQTGALTTLLLARLTSRCAAQRLRRWLSQPITTRRLRGVLGILPQPRFQLTDPARKHNNQRVTLSQRHQQLLDQGNIRKSRTRRIHHATTCLQGEVPNTFNLRYIGVV